MPARPTPAELLAQGTLEEAERELRRLHWEGVSGPEMELWRGEVFFEKAQNRAAAKAFRAALRFDPGFAAAMVGLGEVYLRWSRPEMALKWFNRALETSPGSVKAQAGLAKAHLKTFHEHRALLAAREATRQHSEDPIAWESLVETQVELGDPEVESSIRRLEALDPARESLARLKVLATAVLALRGVIDPAWRPLFENEELREAFEVRGRKQYQPLAISSRMLKVTDWLNDRWVGVLIVWAALALSGFVLGKGAPPLALLGLLPIGLFVVLMIPYIVSYLAADMWMTHRSEYQPFIQPGSRIRAKTMASMGLAYLLAEAIHFVWRGTNTAPSVLVLMMMIPGGWPADLEGAKQARWGYWAGFGIFLLLSVALF